MKQIDLLRLISQLYEFKLISDEVNNTYVVFANSSLSNIDRVNDRTQFEAVENHVHIIENVKKDNYQTCIECAPLLGTALLNSLCASYPSRHFVVFVTIRINDSMIIRFHQKWKDEAPYYDLSHFTSDREVVLKFEN